MSRPAKELIVIDDEHDFAPLPPVLLRAASPTLSGDNLAAAQAYLLVDDEEEDEDVPAYHRGFLFLRTC